MSKPRTVVDLLADQPVEALKQMRDVNRAEHSRVQAELGRLKVEAEQIEQALKRVGSRDSRVTQDDVLAAALDAEPPFTVAAVASILAERGRDATTNAIRNHLNRLVSDRRALRKHEDGRYSAVTPPASERSLSTGDEDIPF